MTERETITFGRLKKLSFCNSKDLPSHIEVDGKRMHWVGIGWVEEGTAVGDEVLVVDSTEADVIKGEL